jgi:polyphosphate kinase
VVRLEVDPSMPSSVRDLLVGELNIGPQDVYETNSILGLVDAMALTGVDRPEHKYSPWEPVVPPRLRREGDPTTLLRKGKTADYPNIFAAIRDGDLLVHHPYESFQESTQRFVEEAAADPQVLAIKQTLYRTSENSPIVAALVDAAEQGKQVAVLVEVKARFDEANNIEWGRMLEESGVHVAYGLVGLKTHAKVTLVIRQEDGEPRTYCHIGTGNYNPKTARQYTDLGLLTCDEDLGYDITNLFHYLTGYAPEQHYRDLLVAPQNMRARFERLIQREIEHARNGGRGRIVAKMNQLNDEGLIAELYRASRAGVEIDLVVRGHCRLRPGLENYSENIRVSSILGRFLEHTRIYYFGNGGDEAVYIGSADWMSRNLNDRVEAIAEVKAPEHRARIVDLLDRALRDQYSAWDLRADGRYVRRASPGPDEARGFQEQLMDRARERTS